MTDDDQLPVVLREAGPENGDDVSPEPPPEKAGKKKQARGRESAAATAQLAGVSAATVERARRVERDAPDLYALIGDGPGQLSVDGAWRKLKERTRQAERERNAEQVQSAGSLEDAVSAGARFSTLVIDPPWDHGDEGDVNQMGRAKPTYETWPLARLRDELPVAAVAAPDCHLYLWITNRSLPKGFELLEAWGFRYVTCLTWAKPSFGMGNYFRGQTEHVLFGVRGSLALQRADVGTVLHAPRPKSRQHSAKPDEFYELVETCSPAPRIDIFGRRARDGWSMWGEGGLA
jgi:N6-adenosine-specific RNA methylase IME4